MTAIADGIAALLAEPHCRTVHCQLLDRWQEEGKSDLRAEALQLVLLHKPSDGPRLLYAEACDLAGDAARAEFVRVQCELAQIEAIEHNCGNGEWKTTCPACGAYGAAEELRQRMWELFRGEWDEELGDFSKTDNPAPVWERGFVASVSCSAADWLKHGDAVCAAHPVERLTLTTLNGWDGVGLRLRRDADGPWRSDRWPGVKFSLPPQPTTYAEFEQLSLTAHTMQGVVNAPPELLDGPAGGNYATYSAALNQLLYGTAAPGTMTSFLGPPGPPGS